MSNTVLDRPIPYDVLQSVNDGNSRSIGQDAADGRDEATRIPLPASIKSGSRTSVTSSVQSSAADTWEWMWDVDMGV